MARSDARASTLWIMLLTLASTVATLVLACATPFAALAALAAVHMRRRDGVLLMIASWVANQAVGFCMLGYPTDAKTIAWGLAIGLAAVASAIVADAAAARGSYFPARIALALVAGFVGFKAVLVLASLGLGGVGVALSPTYAVQAFARNVVALAGLLALHGGLVTIGVPTPRRALA